MDKYSYKNKNYTIRMQETCHLVQSLGNRRQLIHQGYQYVIESTISHRQKLNNNIVPKDNVGIHYIQIMNA